MRHDDDRRSYKRTFILGTALVLALGALLPGAAAAKKKPQQAPTANAQLAFGVEMARRGLWSEALFRFQQADRMAPNNPKTLNNLAVAYEAVGRFDEALDYYKKALAASPTSKDLKKNYSRFVEFYQGFKPDGPDETAGASESSEDAGNTDSGRG
jgi:Tfp pilus assembly protein PilF